MIYVKIKLLKGGKLPEKKHSGDACFDCYARESVEIYDGDRKKVPLGFAMEIPQGYEAVIRPRSGLSSHRIDCCIGTIDSNYRGEVNAIIQNSSDEIIKITKGDRICQIAIRESPQVMFDIVDELNPSERNENGFGSTGV